MSQGLSETKAKRGLFSSNILKAFLSSIIFTLLMFLIFSIVITYTPLSNAYADTIVEIITLISALLGGFIAGKGATSKGWLYGAGVALFYILLKLILSMVFSDKGIFNLSSLVSVIISSVVGALGGIIGINAK